MNEVMAQGAGAIGGYGRNLADASLSNRSTTIAENIDNRIASLEGQIARLRKVKERLATGSLLEVSLEDLQQALARN